MPNRYELDHGFVPEYAGDGAQDADGDGLAKLHSLRSIGAPVNSRDIAALRDVRCDLVQLTADRQRRSLIRQQ